MTAEWVELVKTLGISGPLVGVLLYLLKQATQERQEITTKFLDALKTTVEQSNEQRLRSSTELAEHTDTLREMKRQGTEEHAKIVESIDRLDLRRQTRGAR